MKNKTPDLNNNFNSSQKTRISENYESFKKIKLLYSIAFILIKHFKNINLPFLSGKRDDRNY
ncbi:hypothetical protein BpHYR1_014162 [Brachionus plicatilis]|uniref:Uncharacterized protein n=1 Tax=Brachionus plicatilis TaxID=10195 RepID=A0A3M7P598_BRAPC|nr:hypothetical protein BpHYR1_014162 [Brachionus plicatilis]